MDQLQKLEGILKIIETDNVTVTELEPVLNTLITAIRDVRTMCEESMASSDRIHQEAHQELTRTLTEIEDRIDNIIKRQITRDDLSSIKLELSSEIAQIRNLIPELPDLSYLEKKIAEVEAKIPKIPEIPEITGEDTVNKINSLDIEPDLQIDFKHIKGWEKFIKKSGGVINGGITGRDIIQDIDISSQLDGVTKTFNIPAVWRIISVDLSSFPYGSCRKNTDYTWTPTSITFTSQIDAASQLASGQTCILTVVSG